MDPLVAALGSRRRFPSYRNLTVLLLSQLVGGAGLAAGVTVGALLSQSAFGTDLLAGLPNAAATAGAAGAAAVVGALSQRWGRRVGLAFGYGAAALGSIGAVVAIATSNVVILLLSLIAYGAGSAASMQARYAGAHLASIKHQALAMSVVLMSTSVGVLVGPALLPTAQMLAANLKLPTTAGPFVLAGGSYVVAFIVVAAFLRIPSGETRPSLLIENPDAAVAGQPGPGLRVGAITICGAQALMVAVMTMTPVYMRHNGFSISTIGLVIALHIASMYLPAPLSGYLADRFGSRAVGQLAALVFSGSALVVLFSQRHSLTSMIVALILLGWGWSLGVVAGSAAVTNATASARVQGRIDAGMSIAGALAGVLSGLVVATVGFQWLAVSALALALGYWLVVTRPTRVGRSALLALSFVTFGCSLRGDELDRATGECGYPISSALRPREPQGATNFARLAGSHKTPTRTP
ncbi:major facilitator superfamily transporter [Mycobacteroides abscessus subsp. abscessus]|uniref:MFS transporter n=1 Tax=Mycobacteroides abscessus TaxID=36809 RepID=UPI0009CF7881|nr:MFS transporter [Mycobacteroides abscessus]SKU32068.1 major facilitator superfamily transporter [Mycobacteroides abscessus subsp. abscessus]SKX80349.1 major facilitator superfamily transporter [Mycobacteroides abscessus subsp. abscessus]